MTNLLEAALHVVVARKAMGRVAQHESPLFGKVGHVKWEWQRSFASSSGLVELDIRAQELCGDSTNLGRHRPNRGRYHLHVY